MINNNHTEVHSLATPQGDSPTSTPPLTHHISPLFLSSAPIPTPPSRPLPCPVTSAPVKSALFEPATSLFSSNSSRSTFSSSLLFLLLTLLTAPLLSASLAGGGSAAASSVLARLTEAGLFSGSRSGSPSHFSPSCTATSPQHPSSRSNSLDLESLRHEDHPYFSSASIMHTVPLSRSLLPVRLTTLLRFTFAPALDLALVDRSLSTKFAGLRYVAKACYDGGSAATLSPPSALLVRTTLATLYLLTNLMSRVVAPRPPLLCGGLNPKFRSRGENSPTSTFLQALYLLTNTILMKARHGATTLCPILRPCSTQQAPSVSTTPWPRFP
jgi:hypothetical protein